MGAKRKSYTPRYRCEAAHLVIDTGRFSIGRSVLVFLGIPLMLGYLSRQPGERPPRRQWYESAYLPRVEPWALVGVRHISQLQRRRFPHQPFVTRLEGLTDA